MPTTSQTYLDLAGRFPLDPIGDDAHCDRAIALLDDLLPQSGDEGVEAYVDALAALVEDYESRTIKAEAVSPGEMLGYLMELRGVGADELAREVGVGEADLAAILGDVRPPTAEETVSFGNLFGVNASTFLPG